MKKKIRDLSGQTQDDRIRAYTQSWIERWREYYAERERRNPNGYSAELIEQVGIIAQKPAYKITCPLCCDKVLWFEDADWKLECHCNLLWTITVRDDGSLGAWGKRQ